MADLVLRQPCDLPSHVAAEIPLYHSQGDRWCLGYVDVVLDPDKVLHVLTLHGKPGWVYANVRVADVLAALEETQ